MMKLNASRKTPAMASAYKKNVNFVLSKEPEKTIPPLSHVSFLCKQFDCLNKYANGKVLAQLQYKTQKGILFMLVSRRKI